MIRLEITVSDGFVTATIPDMESPSATSPTIDEALVELLKILRTDQEHVRKIEEAKHTLLALKFK